MKVLHVINSLSIGGAEKLIVETLPIYNKAGITSDLAVLNGTETSFLAELQNKEICKVFILGKSSPYNIFLILKLMSLMRNYDIIHAHLFPSTYFCIIAKILSGSSAKVIFTEHSTSNRRFRNRKLKWINSFFYRRFDRIICITEGVKIQVVKHSNVSEDKLCIINNGINVNYYKCAKPLNRNQFDFGISHNDFLLVQVSSFRPQKDQNTVIQSLKCLPEIVKLLLVGDGSLRTESEKLVEELKLTKRVFFLGNRSDVPEILKACDVVVLSSVHEGLSLSSIEGMASGKPFVASNVPGLVEIVGGAGILFEQGNSKGFAQIISKLQESKEFYAQTLLNCEARAAEFDISKMTDAYILLYHELLN